MKQYGLIGYPLTHSFSKKYFEEKFRREALGNYSYELYPLEQIDSFPALIASTPNLLGINVTIPHKESVMRFLNETDEVTRQTGAVNCIKIENGTLKGYNTDTYGFEVSLQRFIKTLPQQVFVLGTGGSAKAVQYVLKKMGAAFIQVSRKAKEDCVAYADIEQHLKASNLFINTTPLGMYPNTETCPNIPYHRLTANDYLFDLVYNPAETLFLQKGKQQGSQIKNGLEMLELQAEKSWQIWNS